MGVPRQLTINDQEIDLEKTVADALEKILSPVAETICEMERIRRKEYLTEKEVVFAVGSDAENAEEPGWWAAVCKSK